MLRWTSVLAALVGVAVGCGGGSPPASLVFEDAVVEPGADGIAADATAEDTTPLSDQITPEDAMTQEDPAEPEDTTVDKGPEPVCEDDDDCTIKSDDPCTFWFCHPTQKTCKPATYPDDEPCEDGDPCTVGDECWDGVCDGGEDICSEPLCGDGDCDDLEHCESCPEDCGSCDSDCCEAHNGPGCDDKTCEGLLCNVDDFCCEEGWDDYCVETAQWECGICM